MDRETEVHSGIHQAWLSMRPAPEGQSPWTWTSGLRCVSIDFLKEVLYYSNNTAGPPLCRPVPFAEICQLGEEAPPDPCAASSSATGPEIVGAAFQPQFCVTVRLRGGCVTLVAHSEVARNSFAEALLAASSFGQKQRVAAAATMRHSPSTCSTTASTGSLSNALKVADRPARARGCGRFESFLHRGARQMTADERIAADLRLLQVKFREFANERPARRTGEGPPPARHMSSEERRRADLSLAYTARPRGC
mmetsp:Transcript_13993/g.26130  ORF Transcript_13993/g.26130 Transcript_13993/m.26130 type:complete len:251 (-) Transcript_13993:62-814(-)